ncbi:MAG TPA: pyridoxamine 5'-phosphate oxidase family protein [Streptosporangiaceae bacterium]|jgi:general stress protein 26
MALEPAGLMKIALETLRGHPFGFLSTLGRDRVHTRLVEHVAVDDDGTVWIGTSPRSRKVAQVGSRPEVTYAAEDRDGVGAVVMQARAEVVDDERERAARWQDDLIAFFPEGPRGGDFVLLRLRPYRIELMSFAHGVHPEPYGLVPAVIAWDDDGWRTVPAERRA